MTIKAPGVYSPDGSKYVTMTDGAGNLISASQPLVGSTGNPINESLIGSSNFLNVTPPDAGNTSIGWGGPFTQNMAGILFSVDTTGFSAITVQVIQINSSTITYEQSNDNVTWANAFGISSAGGSSQNLTATSVNTGNQGILIFPCVLRYFRARVSTYSGAVTIFYSLRQNWTPNQIPVSTNGSVVSLNAFSSGGSSYTHIAGGAQANTVVKASSGTLYSIVINSQPVSGSVMTIYDNTTATGTTIGIFTAVASEVPPYTMNYGPFGINFAVGLSINVATQNGADMTVCYK